MKGNVFLEELKNQLMYLDKRGSSKDFDTPFDNKR